MSKQPKRCDASNRSNLYQHLYNEICVDGDILSSFQNEESLLKRLNPFEYNEDIFVLEEQLRIEFWRLVEDNLNDRQKDILKGLAAGKTQTEIAKLLSINQSSVVKNFGSNNKIDKNGKPIYSGGSKSKLRNLIDKDPVIQDILTKIAAIRDESWI